MISDFKKFEKTKRWSVVHVDVVPFVHLVFSKCLTVLQVLALWVAVMQVSVLGCQL